MRSASEHGSPTKRDPYNFLLNERDISHLSRHTIIPYVNRHFTYKAPPNHPQIKIKLPVMVICNRLTKMDRHMQYQHFFKTLRLRAGGCKIWDVLEGRFQTYGGLLIKSIKENKRNKRTKDAELRLHQIEATIKIKSILSLSWAFRQLSNPRGDRTDQRTVKIGRPSRPQSEESEEEELENVQKPLRSHTIQSPTSPPTPFWLISPTSSKKSYFS